MSTNAVANRFLASNLALIVCCGCYLLWWILAFKPTSPVTGMSSGWLLIPAFVAGLVGIVGIIWTGAGAVVDRKLFVGWRLVVAGIACYLVLLVVTRLVFGRPVTAELFLMVGWAVLMLSELNALFGAGVFSWHRAAAFIAVIIAALVVCLVCYTIYYHLGLRSGFVVGIIPLALGGVMMAVICISICRSPTR